MKNIMKKMALTAVVASLSLPTFAGVVEHELEAGENGALTEMIFVAKTNKTAIIRIAQPGVDSVARNGELDTGAEEEYGFAFGQPNGETTEGSPWEDYVINTVAPLNGSLQDEICGEATANASDLNQISHAYKSQDFLTEVSGASHSLVGSCLVAETPAEAVVTASVKLGYEVLVSGGSTIDLDLISDNGIEADLVSPNSELEYASFVISEDHFDAAGDEQTKDLQGGVVSMGHGDNGVLTFDMSFEATGANAKPERRASAILTAQVPL